MHRKRLLFYLPFVTTLLFTMCLTASAATAPRISTDELKSQLGSAELVVLDVRGNGDWVKSEKQIVGAERVNPGGATQWASNYSKEKTIVLYCT